MGENQKIMIKDNKKYLVHINALEETEVVTNKEKIPNGTNVVFI